MFTGLIEEVGTVVRIDAIPHGSRLTIRTTRVIDGMRPGDSIAVDGVCLTAVEVGEREFVTEVSPETISRSNLVYYQEETAVNLERPLAAGDRLGGHFVQGHVDATTRCLEEREEGDFVRVTYEIPEGAKGLLVEKGSIAINGVSLTVASLSEETFDVQLIPHTIQRTNLLLESRSAVLNTELDVLGKYVDRLLRERFGDIGGDGDDRVEGRRIIGQDRLIELAGE